MEIDLLKNYKILKNIIVLIILCESEKIPSKAEFIRDSYYALKIINVNTDLEKHITCTSDRNNIGDCCGYIGGRKIHLVILIFYLLPQSISDRCISQTVPFLDIKIVKRLSSLISNKVTVPQSPEDHNDVWGCLAWEWPPLPRIADLKESLVADPVYPVVLSEMEMPH